MADEVNERIRIAASAARCWEIALDFEQYPSWVRDIKRATILHQDSQGRATQVEFRAAALGKSTTYVLEYEYADAPNRFSWKLVSGELLQRLDGSYRFESDGEATRVHYELVADLKVPLPGMIVRRVTSIIMGSALRDLKAHVETTPASEQ